MAEYSEIYYDKKKENLFHYNEDKLCNRLVVCAFAVCFLWATSLQLCTEIVGYYIPSPTFSSVYESCKYAYDATEIQRAVYRDCVNRQLDVCDESLVQSNQKILMTVDRNHKINSKLLQNFEQLVDNSSESLLSAKNALNAWLTLGIDYKIYYSNNASNAEITRAKQIIGDTSKETVSIFASTEEYARDSDSTIVKLAQYSSDLNNYNVQYVHNKTKNLQFKSLSIIDKVSKPQLSFFNNSLAQIDQAMDQLMACIGLQDPTTNNQKCLQSQTLKGLYDNSKMAVNSRIDRLKVEYQNIREIFDDFAAKTEIVVRNALDFYDSIAGKAGIIIWIAKNTNVNAITGSLCGKSSPNWCDFKPADFIVSTPYLPGNPIFPRVPDAEELWSQVSNAPKVALKSIDEIEKQIVDHSRQWYQSMLDEIKKADFTPNDYNPPRYQWQKNTTEEVKSQSYRTQSFLSSVSKLLLQAPNITESTVNQNSFNATAFKEQSLNVFSSFKNSWASYSSVNINFAGLLASFLSVQGVLFFFDYIYRIFLTVRMIRKFWSRGVVRLPDVDVREKKEFLVANYLNHVGIFLQLLPMIWVQALLLIIFSLIVSWIVAALLIPGYQGYVHTCVEKTQNSTFLSKSLYSMGYNYASLDGNSDVTVGVVSYNKQSSQYCATGMLNSKTVYKESLNSFLDFNATWTRVLSDIKTVKHAVDISKMDEDFYTACCSQAEYDIVSRNFNHDCLLIEKQCPKSNNLKGSIYYLPPGFYLHQSQNNDDAVKTFVDKFYEYERGMTDFSKNSTIPLLNSKYQCLSLPKCSISCDPPDEFILNTVTKDCSCMTEWYFNSYMLQSAFAICVYIILNLSRTIIMRGVTRIVWKDLHPAIFEYKANCDIDGNLVADKKVVKKMLEINQGGSNHAVDCESLEKEIDDELENGIDPTAARFSQKNPIQKVQKDPVDWTTGQYVLQTTLLAKLKTYERMGYIFVVIGVIMNMPWIVGLQLMSQNIEYMG